MEEEIVDSIKYAVDEDDWFEIEGHFLKPLLDYITNLQEENEKLKYMLAMSNKELELYTDYVEKENEKLKQKINKAIEYIVTHRKAVDERDEKIIFWLSDDFDEEDLLNILKGEDK